ncbi:MAG: hypothetical protein C0469_00945 [Cyanobacteria bacterium DS2.3.42]|nr:hypothetical protein [Cyanobacteria bacterium DS2.3.42]
MTISLAEREKVHISVADKPVSQRLLYADLLRALAILQVINVHCTVTYFGNLKAASSWWACLFPEVFGRASVPLFLMLSGLFLLDKDISSPFSFLKKRVGRILIPLAVWSGIYLAWGCWFKGSEVNIQRCVAVLGTPAYYHLGYLYFLTGLYLATPLLKVFTKSATKKDYQYFIVLWLISASVLPTLKKLLGLDCAIQLVVATHLTGYFVIGYALKDYVVSKAALPLLWLTAIAAFLACCASTYFLTASNGGIFDPFFVESSSALIFVYSAATLLIFKSFNYECLKKNCPGLLKVGKSIGDSAFTMYLVHPIILDICIRLKLHSIFHKTGFGWTTLKIILLTAIVTLVSWSIVRIGRFLKAPQWLIP